MAPQLLKLKSRFPVALDGLRGLLAHRFALTGSPASDVLPTSRFSWHQSRIAGCASQIERAFTGLAETFESMVKKSEELVKRSRALLKRSIGQEDQNSLFHAAILLVRPALRFSQDSLPAIDGLAETLTSLAERVRKLHRFKSTLDRTIAPLKIIQTMFRIESAETSAETKELFASLSEEIDSLQSSMSSLVTTEFEAIENTAAALRSVIDRLRQIHAQQLKTGARQTELETLLADLPRQIELNAEREDRLFKSTEGIAREVSGIIVALQYQDILNQRLVHVSGSLKAMAAKTLGGTQYTPGIRKYLRDAARVEAAQLAEIETIFQGALKGLGAALEGIARETGERDAECVLLKDIEAASQAGGGMVQSLLDTLAETRGLNESTLEQFSGICQVLEPIAGLVGNQTGNILDLAEKIRRIALNAQIQALHAGGVRGLEVLSSRTRAISQDVSEIVWRISEELTSLKDGFHASLHTANQTREHSARLLDELTASGPEQERGLRAFREEALLGLSAVSRAVAGIREDSKSLLKTLDLRASVLEVTGCTLRELRQFSEEIHVEPDFDGQTEQLDQQANTYTTAAERNIHLRALEKSGEGSPPEAAEEVEGTVEFF